MMKSLRKTDRDMAADVIRKAGEKWPTTFIARSEIPTFTGGLMSIGTIANLDSAGEGPKRFRIGRSIAYPVESLCEWLISRLED